MANLQRERNKEDNDDEVENVRLNQLDTKRVKQIKDGLKQQKKREQTTMWKEKALHGQITKESEKETINTTASWK